MNNFLKVFYTLAEHVFVSRPPNESWCMKKSAPPQPHPKPSRSDCAIAAIPMHILIEVGVGNFRRRPFVVVMSN